MLRRLAIFHSSDFRPYPVLATAIVSSLFLAACGKAPEGGHAGMAGGPVPVAAITVQAETLPITLEYAAQTLGSREVEVRARVTGILQKRNFQGKSRPIPIHHRPGSV